MKGLIKRIEHQFYWERVFAFLGLVIGGLIVIISLSLGFGKGCVVAKKRIATMVSNFKNDKEEKRQQLLLKQQEVEERNQWLEIERVKKQEQEKEKREQHEKLLNTYKKNTRIKINDMNRVVKCGEGFRFSVGAIDLVQGISDNNGFIIGQSGEYWAIETVELVKSNREWKDLVAMENRGELKFWEGEY